MRFAYIDSNGNEVPIPSVDALALRIELGAISENTQLYDAQADQWGPAHTHEIFHTLSRTAKGDGGFVAPPPVAPQVGPPAVEEPAETADVADLRPDPTPQAEAEPPEAEAEPDGSFGLTLADPEPEAAEGGMGLTLAEPEAVEPEPVRDDVGDDLPYLDLSEPDEVSEEADQPLDLAPGPDAGGDASMDLADEAEPEEQPAATFDFGEMDGGLELEEAFEASEEEAMDLSGGMETPAADFSGGMDLEPTMEFGAGGLDQGSSGSLDLETPMSEFTPEDPPSWMDDDAGDDGEVMDFSSVGTAAEPAAEEEAPVQERRTPRTKPSPPKHRKQRNLAGPIIGIVVLLAIGVGGYVAWPLLSARLAGSGDEVEPEVYLPPLSQELVEPMRSASGAALATIFEDVRSGWAQGNPVQEPPSQWLAGIYLANASQYPQVEEFWNGMSDFVSAARDIDVGTFDAAVASELAAAGLAEADVAAARARADSGFVAGAEDRAEIYDSFDAVADAAVQLHRFLVANEANIEYAPASAVTTDPILEVNPASEEIRARMEELLDAVTRSLGALEYRQQVTATGLREAILRRVQESGVR